MMEAAGLMVRGYRGRAEGQEPFGTTGPTV